jgi:hypothetical protein
VTASFTVDGFGVSDVIFAVLVALLTVNVTLTAVAAAKLPLPVWLACTVTDPDPVIVSTLPLTVAGPAVTE